MYVMGTFNLGEKVVLKSSPYMPVLTVLKANSNGTYSCHFVNEKHQEADADYKEDLLQKYVNPATIYIF